MIAQLQLALQSAELERRRYEQMCTDMKQRHDHIRRGVAVSSQHPFASTSSIAISSSVSFLVAGKRFSLPCSYVANCPDSILAALSCGETCPVDVTDAGDIVLHHRSKDAFEVIVKYLEFRYHRDRHRPHDPLVGRTFVAQMHRLLNQLSPAEVPVVRDEAIFFALDELAEIAYRHEVCSFLCDASFGEASSERDDSVQPSRHHCLRPEVHSVITPDTNEKSRVLCMDVLTIPSSTSNAADVWPQEQPTSASPQRPSSTHVTFTASVPLGTTSYMVAIGSESGQVSLIDAAYGGWSSLLQGCSGLDHSIGSPVTAVLWATPSPLVVDRRASLSPHTQLSPLHISLLLTCGRDQSIRCSLVPLHGDGGITRVASQDVSDLDDPTTLERLSTTFTAHQRSLCFASGHASGVVCLWRLGWPSSTAFAQGQCNAEFEKLRVMEPTQTPAAGIRCVAFLASSAMLLIAQGAVVERRSHVLGNEPVNTRLSALDAHQKSVRAIGMSEAWVATGCFGGKVFVWDRSCVESVVNPFTALVPSAVMPSLGTWVASLQFTSPLSQMTLLCVAAGTSLYVTDPRSGSLFRNIDFGSTGRMSDALRCFSLLGPSRLVTGSFDGTVLYWCNEGGQHANCCHWCLRPWADRDD
jgi:WD40 repeat protein